MLLEEAFTHPDAMGADVRDRPAHGHGNQCPSLDHGTGLGAVPSAEITQDGGLRLGRTLFGRHGCRSASKSRIWKQISSHIADFSTSMTRNCPRVHHPLAPYIRVLEN